MRCYVCDTEEEKNWHKVLVHRDGASFPIHSKSTIQICKNCGNACHDIDHKSEEKIKEYYRKEYRPAPNLSNLITTTHKQNYISTFLKDFLIEHRDKPLIVGDVGCATGYLLSWFKRMGHKVTGCEYTVTYRRMAEHYYGVPVAEELDTNNKYDLIVIYHVLEHMIEPDKKLAHYVDLLSPSGHLLVSTPEWFDTLEEASGTAMDSFEHLYHKDHINIFSSRSINNLFRKCGLMIVKEDHRQYGQTYLLKKSEQTKDWLIKENWVDVEREMLRDYKAIELYKQGRMKEALEVKDKFPEAWNFMIFMKTAKDPGRQNDLLSEATKVVGHNCRFLVAHGQWLYQQGRLKEALEIFNKVVEIKPNEDIFVFMGYANAQIGNTAQAIHCFEIAQNMDPRKWAESQTWVLKLISEMPAWDERALAQAKEMLFKSALEKGEIKAEMKNSLSEGDKKPNAQDS